MLRWQTWMLLLCVLTVAAAAAKPAADGFDCSLDFDFITGISYSQSDLTDGCDAAGVCDANPVYGTENSVEGAVAWCTARCGDGCSGFFFQRHTNGHEVCGFYADSMHGGDTVWVKHGHAAGSRVCEKPDAPTGRAVYVRVESVGNPHTASEASIKDVRLRVNDDTLIAPGPFTEDWHVFGDEAKAMCGRPCMAIWGYIRGKHADVYGDSEGIWTRVPLGERTGRLNVTLAMSLKFGRGSTSPARFYRISAGVGGAGDAEGRFQTRAQVEARPTADVPGHTDWREYTLAFQITAAGEAVPATAGRASTAPSGTGAVQYGDFVAVERFDHVFWPQRQQMGFEYYQRSFRNFASLLDWAAEHDVQWGWKEGSGGYGQLFYQARERGTTTPSFGTVKLWAAPAHGRVDFESNEPAGTERIGFVRTDVLLHHPSWQDTPARAAYLLAIADEPAVGEMEAADKPAVGEMEAAGEPAVGEMEAADKPAVGEMEAAGKLAVGKMQAMGEMQAATAMDQVRPTVSAVQGPQSPQPTQPLLLLPPSAIGFFSCAAVVVVVAVLLSLRHRRQKSRHVLHVCKPAIQTVSCMKEGIDPSGGQEELSAASVGIPVTIVQAALEKECYTCSGPEQTSVLVSNPLDMLPATGIIPI